MAYILKMFGISLLLTWLIELPVGLLMGLRGWRYISLLLLVNLLTNPAAVALHLLGVPQIPIEMGVIAVEAVIYCWFARDERWKISHPVLLSVAANLISWISGILIQM